MLIGLLMNALAEELESGIETRLQDIREMQVLFKRALEVFERYELADDMEALTEASPESYTFGAVNALHDRITRKLIELHALVEERSAAEPAMSLNSEIWAYLGRHAERHQITAAG